MSPFYANRIWVTVIPGPYESWSLAAKTETPHRAVWHLYREYVRADLYNALRDTLEALVDCQNGRPLPGYTEWDEAMTRDQVVATRRLHIASVLNCERDPGEMEHVQTVSCADESELAAVEAVTEGEPGITRPPVAPHSGGVEGTKAE